MRQSFLIAGGAGGGFVLAVLMYGFFYFVSGLFVPQDATAVIAGPAQVSTLTPVVFDGCGSRGQVFEWSVEPQCQIYQERERLFVVAPKPGRYQITLVVRQASWGRYSEAKASHVFQAGEGPPPEPGPGPNPGPDPLPDGKYGLAKFAKGECERLVHSPNRREEARKVAAVFRSVAARIRSGNLRTPIEVSSVTLSETESALGDAKEYWKPFRLALTEKTRKTFRLTTPVNEIAIGWLEVATGLEAVR